MPELDAMGLLKKMKDLNPYVRTIVMTAFALDDELFKEYVKREIINAFLQEPIHLDDLRDEVNSQLHTYELRKNSQVNNKIKKLSELCFGQLNIIFNCSSSLT
jgi:response regulator RpfG family c-di-GMP phosphodiesterase